MQSITSLVLIAFIAVSFVFELVSSTPIIMAEETLLSKYALKMAQSTVRVYKSESLLGKGSWMNASSSSSSTSISRSSIPSKLESLSILTYNIWFENICIEERMKKIIEIIKYEAPDVVCLQEVNKQNVLALESNSNIQKSYAILGSSEDYEPSFHGVLMLIKKSKFIIPPLAVIRVPYSTNLSHRYMLIAELETRKKCFIGSDCSGQRFRIATTHLESPGKEENQKNTEIRKNQITESLEILGKSWTGNDHHEDESIPMILAGDMNSINADGHDEFLGSTYMDVWTLSNPKQPGYTYGVTWPQKNGHQSARLDRILLHPNSKHMLSSTDNIKTTLVGEESFTFNSIELYPSDHLGLLSRMKFHF